MAKVKKSGALGMSFLECREHCINDSLLDNEFCQIYRALPIPSSKVWLECIQEVAIEPTEDINNPFHIMGRYELRLHKMGIPTVLAIELKRMMCELTQVALKLGIDEHRTEDVIKLGVETHFHSLSKLP